MIEADRYTKIVYWSDEDQCYVGCCPRLVLGGCHGEDPKTVFSELCEIVDEAIQLHLQDGRPLPQPDTNYDWGSNRPTLSTK
jgi:predicted RNase H-like HicB family nuclease